MAISSNATGLRPGVVTSTTRPTTPYTGMVIFETDTGYLRVWDGSAWDYLSQKQDDTVGLGPTQGLVKIVPSSISSTGGTAATLASDGTINVGTSNTALQVNGVFSSTFDVYLILFNAIDFSGTNDVYFNFDDGASLYNWAYMSMNYNSTTVTGARNQSQANAVIGIGGTNNDTNISLTVRGPYLANRKSFSYQQNTDTYTVVGGGGEDSTTQHTKFKIGTSGTSFSSGTIRVYGYHN